jgi:DNA-binding CsgD family transcriptional regulator
VWSWGNIAVATLAVQRGDLVVPDSLDDRVARLSDGQRQCLALVDQHLSSKEIALRLGISPHTVDQRVRQSLQILGVEKRGEAARLVAMALRDGSDPAYQRLIHQPPYIDPTPAAGQQEGAVGHQIRQADRAGEPSLVGIETEQRPADRWASLPLPFATRSQPANEMSVGIRLLWIVLIALGAAFAAGMYLAGLESLSRMMSSHA